MKLKLFLFVACSFCSLQTIGQTFKWQAELEKVKANGFYKIALGPEIISKTENTNLADIRIFDQQKEIPYLIRMRPDSTYRADASSLKFLEYTSIPSPSISVQEDKTNQRSIVKITFNDVYQVDQLVLNPDGFRYFRRTAWLSETNPLIRTKKQHYSENRLIDFIISSEKKPVIDLWSENRHKELFLVIENEDNPPLLIKNIQAYQKNMQLITYLEKDKQYIVKIGQPGMPLPRYDLSYFNDSIGNAIPFIKVANFKMAKAEPTKGSPVWIKKSWMWIALGLLILFLGYLSRLMVRDMQQKKQES
uniref:hypothetical protein n=1 Tax=Pedobacter schmidteae TaxID=2201271 RepID=UPI000EB2FC7E|nr:hypothetical protein [Pedobacter schmidteae]